MTAPAPVSSQSSSQTTDSLSPTTTSEQDLRTAGQRRINLIWEYSQAIIAIIIVSANVLYAFIPMFFAVVEQNKSDMLPNAFFLVIGFYFGRTNHARIGDEASSGRALPMDDRLYKRA